VKRLLVLPLLLAPLLALAAPVAAAPGGLPTIGPTRTAWFDATYPTTTPTEPPLPAGVTSDDLYVAGATAPVNGLPVPVPVQVGDAVGTVRQVAALAALSFTIPVGRTPASLTLVLTSTPSTASTGTRVPMGVTLEACPASPGFAAGGHQAFDLAPAYDCAGRTSLSTLGSDGRTVVFSDIGRVAGGVQGKVLSFVIRPGTLGADRLVFAKPTSQSLSLLGFDTAPVLAPSAGVVPALPPPPGTPGVAVVPGRPSVAGLPALLPAALPLWSTPAVTLSHPQLPAAARTRGQAAAAIDDSRVRALALGGLALLVAVTALLAFTDKRPTEPAEWGFGRYRGPRQGHAPTL
jgi:hypothetical protein